MDKTIKPGVNRVTATLRVAVGRGNMKKIYLIAGIIVLAMVGLVFLRGSEDDWIKDSRGVWVKHGNPSNIPQKVLDQQEIIAKTQKMLQNAKTENLDLSSGPCLGTIQNDWVLDIAHNPRTSVDNLSENQCADYANGKAHHFIEMDKAGEIIQIH